MFCLESHLQLSQEEVPSDTGGPPGLLFPPPAPQHGDSSSAPGGRLRRNQERRQQPGVSQQLCSSDIPHSLSLSKTRFSLAYRSGFVLTQISSSSHELCALAASSTGWAGGSLSHTGSGKQADQGSAHQGFSAVEVDQAARDHCVHLRCWSCVLGIQKMPALSKCL